MQYRHTNLTELEKRYLRKLKGIKAPHSREIVNGNEVRVTPVRNWNSKMREFNAPTSFHGLKARRGRCVISHEKRLLILERHEARAAFFAELRGE